MHVVIAGDHGKIALCLARLLSAGGTGVLSLIRNPEHAQDVRDAGGEPVLCDLELAGEAEVADAIGDDAVAVVFAAGAGAGSGDARKESMDRDGAIKLLRAAQAAGTRRYVMVSAMGADAGTRGDGFAAYLRAKGEADDALRASDLDWTVVAPGALTDDPGTGRVHLAPQVERGAITRDDVAAVLAAVLAEPGTIGLTVQLVAGDDPVDEAVGALAG